MYSTQKQAVDPAGPVDPVSQNYAEYQPSAPEVASQEPVITKYEAGAGHGYEQPPSYPVPAEKPKRRKILGLAPWLFFTLVALVVLIIVGAIVGGVLGTKKGKSTPASGSSSTQFGSTTSSQKPSSTQSQTASTASSASSTPTSTQLRIIDANYGGVNITVNAIANMQQGSNIIVDMNNLGRWVGLDPWVGITKCLCVLHSLGTNIRTFVACEGDGLFRLTPDDPLDSDHTREITRQEPSSSNFSIVSVVWGAEEVTNGSVYRSIFDYRQNKTALPFTNDLFVVDTLVGIGKTGVIWYTEDNFSTFKGIFGREGDLVPFE